MQLSSDLGGRKTERAFEAVDLYLDIARKHGLDPVQLALAWCLHAPLHVLGDFWRDIDMDQLELALGAADVKLSR